MKHPTAYTFLGFHFNSLVDAGESISLEETHSKIRSKSLFPWLKEKFGSSIDISLFLPKEIDEIEAFFESQSVAINERRKMGVEKNGLCLLVAYCFEAAQRESNKLT